MHAEKYTVAWFKIADCVSRGEKERALGVYRLLAHSFNDVAIAHQLEGDIYLSFNDNDRATQLYHSAAQCYKQSGRLLEAAAIYEHLILLHDDLALYHELLNLYKTLRVMAKVQQHSVFVATRHAHKKEWQAVETLLVTLSDDTWFNVRSVLYYTVISIMQALEEPTDAIQLYIVKAVDDIAVYDDQKVLHAFLSVLQESNEELYRYACDRLKNI